MVVVVVVGGGVVVGIEVPHGMKTVLTSQNCSDSFGTLTVYSPNNKKVSAQ